MMHMSCMEVLIYIMTSGLMRTAFSAFTFACATGTWLLMWLLFRLGLSQNVPGRSLAGSPQQSLLCPIAAGFPKGPFLGKPNFRF